MIAPAISTRVSTRHVIASATAQSCSHLRADHFESIARARIFIAAHAADRAQFVGIDAEILDDPIVHVETDHFAENQAAAARTRRSLR